MALSQSANETRVATERSAEANDTSAQNLPRFGPSPNFGTFKARATLLRGANCERTFVFCFFFNL